MSEDEPSRVGQRAIVLAVVGLAFVGLWLLFGGESPPPSAAPTTSRSTPAPIGSTPTASPEPSSPRQDSATDLPPPERIWSPGGSSHAHPPRSIPGTGSSGGPSTPPVGEEDVVDPHGHDHRPPTQEEIEAAPLPEFGGEFPTDVPPELATELFELAWAWLRPVVEERQLTHLRVVKHGVTAHAYGDDGGVVRATVTIGYTGADSLGGVGWGQAEQVSMAKIDGAWKVTGLVDWSPSLGIEEAGHNSSSPPTSTTRP